MSSPSELFDGSVCHSMIYQETRQFERLRLVITKEEKKHGTNFLEVDPVTYELMRGQFSAFHEFSKFIGS